MVKVSEISGYNSQRMLRFSCPGCRQDHGIIVEGPGAWGYNGDPNAPTFTPSVLVKSGHYAHPDQQVGNCWCDIEERLGHSQAKRIRDRDFRCYICHSFVTDGKIQFLSDCTHELAGQTVELPDWPSKVPE